MPTRSCFTGKKFTDKVYYWHTGHPGGIKERTARQILDGRFPERVLEKAVERMVPRGPLGRQQMTNLRVYAGAEHPHEAQQPDEARRRRAEHQERKEAPKSWPNLPRSQDLGAATGDTDRSRPPPSTSQKLDAQGRAYATGKRKNAIARVWVKPGTGKITVNGKELDAYFARPVLQMILQPADRRRQPRRPVRRRRHRRRRRPLRPGRRRAPRHLQGADLLRAGACAPC